MENDKFQELVLQQLQTLAEGQNRLEVTQQKQGQTIQFLVDGQKQLEEGQKRLEASVDRLETTQQKQGQVIHSLAEGYNRLEAKVDKLELLMENEVLDKIRALFDDREIQNDRFDRIEKKLDSLSTDVSYLVSNIAKLKMLAK